MPTVVTSSIGATGRNYSTIALWEADTDNDLVALDEQHDGELYDDADFAEAVGIGGATTDSTRFRRLTVATGEGYDPVSDTGAWITAAGTGSNPVNLNEPNLEFVGPIGVENTNTGSASSIQAVALAQGTLVKNIYSKIGTGGTGARYRFRVTAGTGKKHINCIAVGGGSNTALNHGYDLIAGTGNATYNCIAHGISNSGNGVGFPSTIERKNCIATDSGNIDFSSTSGTIENITSSDTSASGTGAQTSKAATDLYEAPGSDDFHLKSGSTAIDTGSDLSGTFSDDFDRESRSGTWDRGVYVSGAAAATRRVFLM